jgi:hypothetical protein
MAVNTKTTDKMHPWYDLPVNTLSSLPCKGLKHWTSTIWSDEQAYFNCTHSVEVIIYIWKKFTLFTGSHNKHVNSTHKKMAVNITIWHTCIL